MIHQEQTANLRQRKVSESCLVYFPICKYPGGGVGGVLLGRRGLELVLTAGRASPLGSELHSGGESRLVEVS